MENTDTIKDASDQTGGRTDIRHKTIWLKLPSSLYEAAKAKMQKEGYSSFAEYFRNLVRADVSGRQD